MMCDECREFEAYLKIDDLEEEITRLAAENSRLREALAKVSGIVDFATAGGE